MNDELAPYLRPPLSLRDGRVESVSLEDSIHANLRLIIANPVQGDAKGEEVAAQPQFGAALPHHEFQQGRAQDVVQQVRIAIRRNEPRFNVERIEFVGKKPGRYLPYRTIRIIGSVKLTGQSMKYEIDMES